jgi:DNA-binding transcriptional regulator YdaS (Cro superfamily)
LTRLANYLKDNRIKQKDFAETIGVSEGYLSQICKGTHSPSLSVAVRVEDATSGAVTVRDLLPANHPALRLLRETEAAA